MGRRNARRLRLPLFLGIGAVAGLIALALYYGQALRSQELSSLDARFSIRGSLGSPRDVVLVEIDTATLSAAAHAGLSWPLPRSEDGEVIDHLRAAGAKVIAFDVQFTQPTTPAQDNALINAVARAGNVVLATTQVYGNGQTNVFGGGSILREIHATVGDALFPTAADGVIRQMPYEVQGLQGFAIATAELASGRRIPPSALGGASAWIDYVGPPGTVAGVSFERVLEGRFNPELVRGKVVVIGPTAPILQDIHPTPVSSAEMAGAEVEANAIETALRGFPLQSLPSSLDALLCFVLAFVAPAACLRLSPLPALGAALAAGFLYAVAAQLAFDHGLIVSFVDPLVGLGLATVGSIAAAALLTIVEREQIRDLFGRFVPAEVVDEVLAQAGGDLRLGGTLRTCTMMFTDLRGFTTFAESRAADEVIAILNHYFGEMSEAVLGHGGTLVSYLGDGMMAVFGAPLEQADHADRALAAAREMLVERLPRVNAWISAQGYGDGFRMGIGLNSGPTMAGNIGSERRLEFTTIGDTVNTASRLEGLTKETPYPLFVAESTCDLLRERPDDLVYVDELEVRGRSATVKVWSLAGLAGEPTPSPAAGLSGAT
jgi:adenylate cyclase